MRCPVMEYPAMIYRTNRNRTYVANCIVKNLIGFGRTEEDAINNLKVSLQDLSKISEIIVKPMYSIG